MVSFKIQEQPKQELYWKHVLQIENINFSKVYNDKILSVGDKKIAEFNFKILHQILPCNYKLFKWRKKDCAMCKICNTEETIEHLVFQCKYANRIWVEFENILHLNLDLHHIVLGVQNNKAMSFVISVIAFLIYKEWLVKSMKNEERSEIPNLHAFREDLKFRSYIYKHLGWKDIHTLIEKCIK